MGAFGRSRADNLPWRVFPQCRTREFLTGLPALRASLPLSRHGDRGMCPMIYSETILINRLADAGNFELIRFIP